MSWNPIKANELEIAKAVIVWIQTARASGYGDSDWLPSDADIEKSALFERLRSGKEPLEFPPPRGLSCPWYALIEDKGPHYVGNCDAFGPYFGSENDFVGEGQVSLLQNSYDIVTKWDNHTYTIKDAGHDTPYRFKLWFNKDWIRPHSKSNKIGGWFLQNMEFDSK